jgi:hypothetical protein
MEEFIHRENLIIFKRQLAGAKDDPSAVLLKLRPRKKQGICRRKRRSRAASVGASVSSGKKCEGQNDKPHRKHQRSHKLMRVLSQS